MALDPIPAIQKNQLLQSLSAADLAMLEPHLVRQEFPLRMEFEKANRPVTAVYFPEHGIGSVVARTGAEEVEVGVIGRDGMTGHVVMLGNDRSPHSVFMQVAGGGLCMSADALRNATEESPTLRRLLLRYIQAFGIQTAHTALANARGNLEERLARWLLMAHDRLDGDELLLKHSFLSLMLGVRRAGVTLALRELASAGLIETKRGCIVIVDREGLEAEAKGMYGTPEREYRRLMRLDA